MSDSVAPCGGEDRRCERRSFGDSQTSLPAREHAGVSPWGLATRQCAVIPRGRECTGEHAQEPFPVLCGVRHAAKHAAALPERRSGDASHAFSDNDLANSLCKARGRTKRTGGQLSGKPQGSRLPHGFKRPRGGGGYKGNILKIRNLLTLDSGGRKST